VADVKIRIIGEDKASQELKKIDSSLGGLKDGLVTAAETAAAIGASFAAVGLTVDQIMRFGEAGAQITQTKESFETLLEKIDASPELFAELQRAAGGTMSEIELMQVASLLLAGTQGELATKLSEASPELLEIARAAHKLNPLMGDTNFMFDSLARGLRKNSPMILDNANLTIKVGEANEKYAEKIGKTVGELSTEEQQLAMLNEILEQGRVLVDQAGGSVDNATDSFSRLDAAVTDSSNALKEKFSPFLAQAAESAALLLTWQDQLQDSLITHENEVSSSAKTYDEYRNEINRAAKAAGYMLDEQGNLTDMITTASGRPMEKLIEENHLLTEEELKAERAARGLGKSVGSLVDRYSEASVASEELSRMTDEEREAIELANEVMEYSEDQILANKVALEYLNEVLDASVGYYVSARDEADKYTLSLHDLLTEIKNLETAGVSVSGSMSYGYGGESHGSGTVAKTVNLNVDYSPFVSCEDEYRALNLLRPIVQDIVREMK
jgi:hypothetical protein